MLRVMMMMMMVNDAMLQRMRIGRRVSLMRRRRQHSPLGGARPLASLQVSRSPITET